MSKVGIVTKLLNTGFVCKPGTEAFKTFGNKKVYIAEINTSGYLALTNHSPKTRRDGRQEDNEINSAWHHESELVEIIKTK